MEEGVKTYLYKYQYWNGEPVADTLTARNAGGGGKGCQTNKILIVWWV